MTVLHITAAFDGGNIKLHSADDRHNIRLSIRPDRSMRTETASGFYQWFYFRLSGAKHQLCSMVIENAGGAAYAGGWDGYKACASYDRQTWFRVPTCYKDGRLIITHEPELDSIYYAYFAPYSMERHADLIAECLQHSDVSLRVLGASIEGRDLECLLVGEGDKNIWMTARQHPGETMAEWWVEGCLARLLDDDDPVARRLRQKARFYIIPNMNPDGSYLGNLRTNAVGSNLNREWGSATIRSAPEVYYTAQAMDIHRPDLCLDVHGDETLPYNFIAATQGIPGYSDKQDKNLGVFLSAYKAASPDFQTRFGYPVNQPNCANLSLCANYTAHRFGCLSMTLEMPFKDNADLPDEVFGWSPERAAKLGGSALDAILAVIDRL